MTDTKPRIILVKLETTCSTYTLWVLTKHFSWKADTTWPQLGRQVLCSTVHTILAITRNTWFHLCIKLQMSSGRQAGFLFWDSSAFYDKLLSRVYILFWLVLCNFKGCSSRRKKSNWNVCDIFCWKATFFFKKPEFSRVSAIPEERILASGITLLLSL